MTHPLPPYLERVVITLCDDIGSEVSAKVKNLVKTHRWDELVSMRLDPLAYDCPEAFARDIAAVSFLRKCSDLPTTVDRRQVAIDNFWASERQCKRTNLRLDHHFWENELDGQLAQNLTTPSDACTLLIAEARKEMARLLGPCPDQLHGRFGPGATYADKGQLTTVPDKMSSRPTMTPGFWPHLFNWVGTQWASACSESGRHPETVRGCRYTTVPKDCSKDRGIAVEPSLNSFFQLAYGRAMRRRLRLAGINLKDGQSIHKQVACEASISGQFATIDLSNASDTVSSALVKLLLPADWYEVLAELRSPTIELEGKTIRLEKFSSMGNGYTFELETAIFLVISLAVQKLWTRRNPDCLQSTPGDGIWVYGDDIIVPTFLADDVIGALRYLGFTLNNEKSFLTGEFRESCGGDYLRGVDVRPFFLKEYPREPQHFIAMANGIRRMGLSDPLRPGRDAFLRRAWFCVLDNIPVHIRRLRGPQALGDLVIHDEAKYWHGGVRRRSYLNYIRVYRPAKTRVIGWEHFRPSVVLATALYGTGDGRSGVTPRDAVLGYRIGWVPLPEATSKWLPRGSLSVAGPLVRVLAAG